MIRQPSSQTQPQRRMPAQQPMQQQPMRGQVRPAGPMVPGGAHGPAMAKRVKRQQADKLISPQVRHLVPESQAYMDLLSFEHKLDGTIARKKLDIQEALKRPMKVKRRLRIFVSHTFSPGKEPESGQEGGNLPTWELRVEGRLLDEDGKLMGDTNKDGSKLAQPKRKFSSFFKSLVIELDKELYGPDNHLVEWHRNPQSHETDGFQVKRPGDRDVKCNILLLLDYHPMKYKLHPRLARLLGIHTDTRPKIIEALWQYVKTHKLQDATERDYINCDQYLKEVFEGRPRLRFMEVPQRLQALLLQPDPIQFVHDITLQAPDAAETKKTVCYDIDVEIEDPLKQHMTQFTATQLNHHDITVLDNKIYDLVEQVNEFKLRRDFYLGLASDPKTFIDKWLVSQSADLKAMQGAESDVANRGDERKAEYYQQPAVGEAVHRYYYAKIQQRRAELEIGLGIRNC